MLAYVINLDCRPERMAFMQDQLNRLGVHFTRISAINGLDDKEITSTKNHQKISGPERACYKSHLKAYAALLRSDAPHALVLEDDMLLASTFRIAVEELGKKPLTNTIVRLEIPIQSLTDEASRIGYRPFAKTKSFRLERLLSDVYGLGAYVIDRKTAQFILKNHATPQMPIDMLLLCKNKLWLKRAPVLQLDPPQAVQHRYLANPKDKAINESDLETSRALLWETVAKEKIVVKRSKIESPYFVLALLKQGKRNFIANSTKIINLFAKPLGKLWIKITIKQKVFRYKDEAHRNPDSGLR